MDLGYLWLMGGQHTRRQKSWKCEIAERGAKEKNHEKGEKVEGKDLGSKMLA